MPIVTIAGRVSEEGLSLLRARPDIELLILDAPDDAALRAAMGRSAGVLVRTAPITAELIAASPHLRVVSRHGVGYDNVDVAALTARGIPLVVAATANMVSVAEHAIWMMLELAKHGRAIDTAMRQGDWRVRDRLRPSEIAGKTLLIVGFGRIGSRVAARARAFDMQVLVHDPYVAAGQIEAAGGTAVGTLAQGLEQADIVTLHCPLDTTTRHLIDAAALARLGRHAVLVNTARGGLVDEAALAAALTEGRIAAAGVDVFELEPPPANHPLFGLPNVVLSPHNAGVTRESSLRMAQEAAANILAALDGQLDPGVVINREVLAA